MAIVVKKNSLVLGVPAQAAAQLADVINGRIKTELVACSRLPTLVLMLQVSTNDLDGFLVIRSKRIDVHQWICHQHQVA